MRAEATEMQAALKMKTRVLPGKRIEVTSPELADNEEVELIVLRSGSPREASGSAAPSQGVWDYVQSLKPVGRTPEEWADIERELQEEKNSWER
jgi:hypothetical protein